MPARIEARGVPDVYVYYHKETKTYLIQLGSDRARKRLGKEFANLKIYGTSDHLAVGSAVELEKVLLAVEKYDLRSLTT